MHTASRSTTRSNTASGDIEEQSDRGSLWVIRQTIAALFALRGPSHRGDGMLSSFIADMRIGARHLRRAPAFAVTAIATLGIAIGATTAIFSVIEPVLLRPLPLSQSGPARIRLGARSRRVSGQRWLPHGSRHRGSGEVAPVLRRRR